MRWAQLLICRVTGHESDNGVYQDLGRLTLLFRWLWVCARLGFRSTGGGNDATYVSQMAVKQKPTDMSELLRSYADDRKDSAVAMLNYCTSIPYLVEPVLPVRRRQMLQKLYRERWKVQTILRE